jgi:hypothetical protein
LALFSPALWVIKESSAIVDHRLETFLHIVVRIVRGDFSPQR